MFIITFIIPTIGRLSLNDTINSLYNLENKNWNAIIIFDGIKNNFQFNDERLIILEIDKVGKIDKKNNAGCVRNIGFDYIKNKNNNIDTEFIGFVDDDDTLHPKYIHYLLEEKNINNHLDLIIFRMIYKNNVFLPSKFDTKIKVKHFGISFAFKKKIINNVDNYFINYPYEDYLFLKNIEKNHYKIIISPFINYFIETKYTDFNDDKINLNLPRVLINF